VNATYMSETFPASIRGPAVGTSDNVGRIGSTISPLLIGTMATTYSIGAGIALLGVAYAICAPAGIAPVNFFPDSGPAQPASVSRQHLSNRFSHRRQGAPSQRRPL